MENVEHHAKEEKKENVSQTSTNMGKQNSNNSALTSKEAKDSGNAKR